MAYKTTRRDFLRGSLVLAAGMLTACAPAAAPQTGGQTGGSAAPAQGSVALRWDTFRGIGTGWNEERIDTFKELYPNVTVELRPLAGTNQQDNYAKMYAAHAAGDLGEVCAFDPSHFHFWRAIDKNIIMPIDDLVSADGLDLGEWYEIFMGLQYNNGKLYGLPSWGWAGWDTLVTNAAHFRAEGIELPDPMSHDTSMETIAEWARRFYKEGERFGLNVGHAEPGAVTLCRSFGGDFINAEGTQCLILDDPGAVEAFRWVYELAVEEKLLPAAGTIENIDSAQAEGKVTMNWGGSLNVRNVKRNITAQEVDPEVVEVSQILLPEQPDGKYPSQLRGGTWNVRQGAANAEMAFQFVKHIAGKDGTIGFNLVGGNFAAVRPDALEALVEQDPIHEWFIPNLENGQPAHAPANSRGREYTDAITQYMNLLLDPNQTVAFEKGLQDLHDNVQKVLDMEPA
jgi:ABC-type glycerol-3-phosphate transport system substrate-binding protein